MPREIHSVIQNAISEKEYSFQLSPFPIQRDLNQIKSSTNKVVMQFGLKSQDKLDFIERAMSDKMGWKEISNCIGWIDYAVFESYYECLYSAVLEDIGLTFMDCHRPKTKNKVWLNPDTNKLEVVTENDIDYNDKSYHFKTGILNVQFYQRDKDKFEACDKKFPELYLIGSNPAQDMKYHTYMQIDGEPMSFYIESDNYYFLIEEILLNIKKGYKLESPVYFDIPTINSDEKYYTSTKALSELLELQI